MIRLEKSKHLSRLSEDDQKRFKAEIRAARKVTNLIKDILEETTAKLYNDQVSLVDNPTALAGNVLAIQELKKMTNLLQETEE